MHSMSVTFCRVLPSGHRSAWAILPRGCRATKSMKRRARRCGHISPRSGRRDARFRCTATRRARFRARRCRMAARVGARADRPGDTGTTAPDVTLTLHDGRRATLAALLSGKTTVLQLMFTGCSATCPIQGAVFVALQSRLAAAPATVQLLSISIDALADDANALAGWRRRFGASPRWLAGVPRIAGRAPARLRARSSAARRRPAYGERLPVRCACAARVSLRRVRRRRRYLCHARGTAATALKRTAAPARRRCQNGAFTPEPPR